MQPTIFQPAEIRDSNDNIIRQGAYGKNSPLANARNDAWIDYVMNNLEFLYDLAKDEIVPVDTLPASGDMNKTYLLTTTGVCYRWDGTEWVEIYSSEAVGRAETAANLAEQWATKTNGTVADNEYSAKHYSNVSKDWANKLNATVDGSEYSAKHYAGVAEGWAEDAEDTAEDIADHLAQIEQNTGGVSANSKRITNIEKLLQGNLYDYDTDDDTAYTKSVPAGAMPYAGLEKVGGKTVVWNQLIHIKDTGAEWLSSDSATETIHMNFTSTSTASSTDLSYSINFQNQHKYLFKMIVVSGSISEGGYVAVHFGWYGTERIYSGSTGFAKMLTPTDDLTKYLNVQYINGVTYDNLVLKGMLIDLTTMYGAGNEPSTVAEFEQRFPVSWYSYSAPTLLSAGVTEVVSKKADTTTLATYPIPTAIRNLEGYGWSAGSVYNYIDYERKVFVKNVARVDMGSLTWNPSSIGGGIIFFTQGLRSIAKPVPNNTTIGNILCVPYVTTTIDSLFNNLTTNIAILTNSDIGVRDTAYSNINNFISDMNGVYLYYELATPIETDISQYLTDDNLINVESGGTLTFPNQNGDDYRLPVPSEETYMIDLQSAIGG